MTDTILCSHCGVKTGFVATEHYKGKPLCHFCYGVQIEWENDARDIPKEEEGGDV